VTGLTFTSHPVAARLGAHIDLRAIWNLAARRKVGVSCWASPVTHPELVTITRISRPQSAPAAGRRDRRRAEGDARGAEGAASLNSAV
jgi:hypothetical protein